MLNYYSIEELQQIIEPSILYTNKGDKICAIAGVGCIYRIILQHDNILLLKSTKKLDNFEFSKPLLLKEEIQIYTDDNAAEYRYTTTIEDFLEDIEIHKKRLLDTSDGVAADPKQPRYFAKILFSNEKILQGLVKELFNEDEILDINIKIILSNSNEDVDFSLHTKTRKLVFYNKANPINDYPIVISQMYQANLEKFNDLCKIAQIYIDDIEKLRVRDRLRYPKTYKVVKYFVDYLDTENQLEFEQWTTFFREMILGEQDEMLTLEHELQLKEQENQQLTQVVDKAKLAIAELGQQKAAEMQKVYQLEQEIIDLKIDNMFHISNISIEEIAQTLHVDEQRVSSRIQTNQHIQTEDL
ncbi:MAG: hypothetical protein ATN35_04440 [Epulopiscium sp. Nele67-Bin004]|nr:MAG: hypothetical protein ATN35_04440 [Epulopiscium sp. Nele67-Bin004]